MQIRTLLTFCASACLYVVAAVAQTPSSRNIMVASGKEARVAVVGSLTPDCKVGSIGEIRITIPPKNGSTSTKIGKLKTPATNRCPNIETPVQGLFYTPNAKFIGNDEIGYEVKMGSATRAFKVQITVTDKPAQVPAPDKKESLEL